MTGQATYCSLTECHERTYTYHEEMSQGCTIPYRPETVIFALYSEFICPAWKQDSGRRYSCLFNGWTHHGLVWHPPAPSPPTATPCGIERFTRGINWNQADTALIRRYIHHVEAWHNGLSCCVDKSKNITSLWDSTVHSSATVRLRRLSSGNPKLLIGPT
jgi:hypothetical protein